MKLIYLEPDEEITSVIEKISSVSDYKLGVVVPKNSSLLQSLVNLKLLAREAKRLEKEVAVISKDKVGQRLAKQVGLATYASANDEPSAADKPQAAVDPISESLPDGTRVNHYIGPVVAESPVPAIPEEVEAVSAPTPMIEEPAREPVVPAVIETSPETTIDETVEPLPQDIEPAPVPTPTEPVKVDDLPAVISRSSPLMSRHNVVVPWKSLLVASGIILLGLLVVYIFLPKATVTLTFPAKPINQTLVLAAKTTVDSEETTIPGSLLETEKSATQTVTATGKKDIGTKATGTITITNKYRDSSGVGKDQTFNAGTTVTESKSKKTFTLNKAVTVSRVTYDPNSGQPQYQSKTAEVTASEPGEAYNVAASNTFSIAGMLDNTEVTNGAAFTGGLTKQVTVLSQEDVDKALADLKAKTLAEGVNDLKAKATGQTLLESAIQQTVKEQKVDKEVGSQVDSANATLSLNFSVIVFDQKAAEAKLISVMEKQLGENQQLVLKEGSVPTPTFKAVNADKTELSFELTGDGFAAPKIDKMAVAKLVHHASTNRAKQKLTATYQPQKVEISLRPGWWIGRLPLLSQAIDVQYGFTQE